MTLCLELKEKLKEIYAFYGQYLRMAGKFLLALAVFMGINRQLPYAEATSDIFILLILSLICAIVPLNGMVFLAMMLILFQCANVHILAAAFGAILFLALWVLYLRFAPGEALALVLTPLAFTLHIPAAVPIAFGLVGGPASALSVSCGLIVYFFMQLVDGKIVLLAQAEEVDMLGLIKALTDGMFQNDKMITAIICCVVTLLVVCMIRSLETNYAWQASIVAGGVAYLLIQFAGAMLLEIPVDTPLLLTGTFVSCVICFVLEFFVFGGDYSRSQKLMFKDDEYYYYVKAIPRMAVANSKRIVSTFHENTEKTGAVRQEPEGTKPEVQHTAALRTEAQKLEVQHTAALRTETQKPEVQHTAALRAETQKPEVQHTAALRAETQKPETDQRAPEEQKASAADRTAVFSTDAEAGNRASHGRQEEEEIAELIAELERFEEQEKVKQGKAAPGNRVSDGRPADDRFFSDTNTDSKVFDERFTEKEPTDNEASDGKVSGENVLGDDFSGIEELLSQEAEHAVEKFEREKGERQEDYFSSADFEDKIAEELMDYYE